MLIKMLTRQKHETEYLFGKKPEQIRRRIRANFHWLRGHLVAKTANKEFLKVHLHSFQHFFATKLYLQTHDIRYVQKKLRHRSIRSTTIYEDSEPSQEVETFTSKVATSDKEKMDLINLGYEYTGLNTADGQPIMRRKALGFD